MIGKDIHKQKFTDAKKSLGPLVQLFAFTFTSFMLYLLFLGLLTVLLVYLIPGHESEMFSAYMGSFFTFSFIYIKFGTND